MSNFFDNLINLSQKDYDPDEIEINEKESIKFGLSDKSDFESKNIPEINKSTCVVGITTSGPYDSSVFVNNDNTYYTQISYDKLDLLIRLIECGKEPKEDNKDIKNMNLLYVANCFFDDSVKIIFRFLCSPDCDNGKTFINKKKTKEIFKFVKLLTTRDCVIEISDHSMGSFFNNWDNDFMQMNSPIKVLDMTHSGPFKMYGNKKDFINSIHPTLNQIGDLSSDDNIEITFVNMGGTKVYEIIEPNDSNDSNNSSTSFYKYPKVTLISKGKQITTKDMHRQFGEKTNEYNEKYFQEVPVHCEFDYNCGKIVVSSTHWCNLQSVDNSVDLPSLSRYCTNTFGADATQNLEYTLSCAQNDYEYKNIISTAIREISSGSRPSKKSKLT